MAAEVGGMSDERLCTVCNGRQMIFVQGPNASHPCEHCRGTGIEPATPSTDEGEARWERMEESPDYVVWRKRWAEGYSESSAVPKAIEAAIRAPLEERIRELEDDVERLSSPAHRLSAESYARQWQRYIEFKERAHEAEAEVERLREALRPLVAAYDGGDLECPHFHFCPAHRDRVRNGGPCNCGAGEIEAAIENARALTTPPSSTEGDGTQVPD